MAFCEKKALTSDYCDNFHLQILHFKNNTNKTEFSHLRKQDKVFRKQKIREPGRKTCWIINVNESSLSLNMLNTLIYIIYTCHSYISWYPQLTAYRHQYYTLTLNLCQIMKYLTYYGGDHDHPRLDLYDLLWPISLGHLSSAALRW